MPVKARDVFMERRGLDQAAVEAAPMQEVSVAALVPNPAQPRRLLDPGKLQTLAEDIKRRGLIEPLIVRPLDAGRYEVVAGGRRLQALILAGVERALVRVLDLTDAEARALSIRENLHREDLDPEDEGRYYLELQAGGLSLREIAADVGTSHMYIQRRVRLASDPGLLAAYRRGAVGLRAIGEGVEPVDWTPVQDAAAQLRAEVADVPTLDYSDPAAIRRPDGDPGAAAEEDAPSARREPVSQRVDNLVKLSWRDRPLDSFMTYIARVDPGTVPEEERASVRQRLAAARAWLEKVEAALG